MAAQTSRDRKKARMEDMEKTIEKQSKDLGELKSRCKKLQAEKDVIMSKYERLEQEYEKLKIRMEIQEAKTEAKPIINNIPEEHKYNRPIDSDSCLDGIGSIKSEGSAVSNIEPLQKVIKMEPNLPAQMSMPKNRQQNGQVLWKIIALCLLYRTCSKTSTLKDSKSLPKAYSQMSQNQWKQVIMEAAKQMPKIKALESDCLDQWWGPAQHSWNPPNIMTLL